MLNFFFNYFVNIIKNYELIRNFIVLKEFEKHGLFLFLSKFTRCHELHF